MHFTNIVHNLLDNALKYGGENSVIDIALQDLNTSLELSVRDSGIGIPKEYQKKIFEKFFRVPSGDVHNVKGYGLGLNYVASVVKKMDGKIEVKSDPGQGSLFKITLPKQGRFETHNGRL
jgi:signal transduction histidine kinase